MRVLRPRGLTGFSGRAVEQDPRLAASQGRQGLPKVERLTEFGLLHVGIARRADSGKAERQLDQAGTVDAEGGAAAPQIGRTEETFGDGDEV